MRRLPIPKFILAMTGTAPALWLAGAALAQRLDRPASNITPSDARSVIAPALPAPPVPSADPPSAFLTAARRAVILGRTGEAQEALERAETRLLDRGLPLQAAFVPDSQQAVLAIGAARRALAAHDRQGAATAIDDALAASGRPATVATVPARIVQIAPPPTLLSPPPPEPVITRALLPGRWALEGARYVWVPPERTPRRVRSLALVPGSYVWRNGSYFGVPTHYAY